MFNVIPLTLELLTVNDVKFAVAKVTKFLKTPEPEIVCAFEDATPVVVGEFNIVV